MKILSLDPSSTYTGYAVLTDDEQLLEGGLLRGKSTSEALYRVLAMRDDLIVLLRDHKPDIAVVETPLTKQYTRTPGKKSGMAVWAGAAWALLFVLYERLGTDKVYPVDNMLWTRGTAKPMRQRLIAAEFPKQYDPDKDKGGDIADAIALALWWLASWRKNDLLAATMHHELAQ